MVFEEKEQTKNNFMGVQLLGVGVGDVGGCSAFKGTDIA